MIVLVVVLVVLALNALVIGFLVWRLRVSAQDRIGEFMTSVQGSAFPASPWGAAGASYPHRHHGSDGDSGTGFAETCGGGSSSSDSSCGGGSSCGSGSSCSSGSSSSCGGGS